MISFDRDALFGITGDFIRRVALEKLKTGVTNTVTREFIESLGIEVTADHLGMWLIHVSAEMFAVRTYDQAHENIYVPDTWYDHLKQNLQAWIRKRPWGVMLSGRLRYRTHAVPTRIIHYRCCPHLPCLTQRRPGITDALMYDRDQHITWLADRNEV